MLFDAAPALAAFFSLILRFYMPPVDAADAGAG